MAGEKSITASAPVPENIVRNANRQLPEWTVKNKELRIARAELEELLRPQVVTGPSEQPLRATRRILSCSESADQESSEGKTTGNATDTRQSFGLRCKPAPQPLP